MPAVVFRVRSITELHNIRAQEQPNDPAIYTGIPEPDGALKLRVLTYAFCQFFFPLLAEIL